MLPTEKKDRVPSTFAPSPPLSATPGTPDCELDQPGVHTKEERPLEQERQDPRLDSSPLSTASSSSLLPPRSIPSALSSFTASNSKHEEPDTGRARSRRGRSRHRRGGDIDTAFSLIKASFQGQLPEELGWADRQWCPLRLSPAQYVELCTRLDESGPGLLAYFENTLRSDYDPGRGRLVLRLMESVLHEWFSNSIFGAIRDRVHALATERQDTVFSTLVGDIGLAAGRTSLDLSGKVTVTDDAGTTSTTVHNRRCPDGQLRFKSTPPERPNPPYRFPGRHLPQMVIETGYSQKAKALQGLAWDYYVESHGMIKTVLTISLEDVYRGRHRAAPDGSANKKATLCLYRGPDRICHDVVFRSADGQPVDGSLRLLLSDLVPDEVLEDVSRQVRSRVEDTVISIPFDMLCDYLKEAEREQSVDDAKEAPRINTRKRPNWERDPDSDEGDHGSPSKRRRTGTDDTDEDHTDEDHLYQPPRSLKTYHDLSERQTRSLSRGKAPHSNS